MANGAVADIKAKGEDVLNGGSKVETEKTVTEANGKIEEVDGAADNKTSKWIVYCTCIC